MTAYNLEMGQHAIEQKLDRSLRKEVRTESHAVYIMVQIGKLLEHAKQKDKYPIVNFYRNWAVHTPLTQSAIAEKVVRDFDMLHQMIAGEAQQLSEDLGNHFAYTPFRK